MPLFFTVTCNRISRNVENVSFATIFSLILKHVVKNQVVVYLEVEPSHLLSFPLCEKSQTHFQECTTCNMSLCVRKPTICIGENKDADQLRGNREADQSLCFRYTDSTFPPLLIPKFSRFWVSSVTVQAGLCWTWSETQSVGFVMHRLI